jgi:hypothetical protein
MRGRALVVACGVVTACGGLASCGSDPAPGGGPSDGGLRNDAGQLVDSDGNVIAPPRDGTVPPVEGAGHILYKQPGGAYYLVEAKAGAQPRNVSAALGAVSQGGEQHAAMSADGKWLVLNTTRFGCANDQCLAVVPIDLSRGEPLVAGGSRVTGIDVRPAIASGGDAVVFADGGGPHTLDLYVTRRQGGAWSARSLLTAQMSTSHAHDFQISADGLRVVFDCGPDPYGAAGTSVCEVGLDGAGFRVVSAPADLPGGSANHHPSPARDGSVVFEGTWGGEQIWRVSTGKPAKVATAKTFPDDNSPCVLPDGRVASLWLNRPGNPGNHELKIMNADGSGDFMLVTGVDIVDDGITCGN